MVSTSAVHLAVTLNVQQVPSEGDQVRASSAVSSPGGGFIIAEGARRQGVRTFLASPLGTGPNSHSIRRSLMASGIETFDTAFVGDIGVAVTMVESDGKMAQVVAPGVEAEPTRELLDQIPLEDGDLVHVSGADLVSASGATAIVKWVKDLPEGVRLVVAASPAVALVPTEVWLEVLARADVLTINIREAALLNALLKPYVTAEWFQGVVKPTVGVVRRMGPLGCEVIEDAGKKRKTIPAMTARPVDTTGVGDTHVAVMCASLLRGDSLVDACRRANAAAAIEISHATAFPLPSSDAVDIVLATGDARDALEVEAEATFPLRQE
ncbi:PfkB family carbohydrate kinase [Actinomyces minihominis]|uniref:PfkB family carbohydrate kinase n=1 Tax=Actinomyces minihominis TaxID=2002838 RepID=UPI0013ED8E9D|nr:PfkB family carbohydrate kinase [Actinomyces minihominis]